MTADATPGPQYVMNLCISIRLHSLYKLFSGRNNGFRLIMLTSSSLTQRIIYTNQDNFGLKLCFLYS